VIPICLFSVISISIASYITSRNLAGYAREISLTLGSDAMQGSSDALLAEAHHFLQIILHEQSSNCNNMLNTIKFNVQLLEGVVQDIFDNPQDYPNSRPIMRPSQAVEGVYGNTYSLSEKVPMTPAIQREINLLSNLNLLMPMLVNPNIIELYVGMESGLFYNYTATIFENPEYDPRIRPWYIAALDQPNEVTFTEVYEDAFGLGMVITAAKAIFDKNGKLIGVAALDILLEDLKKLVTQTQVTDSGYTFIINGNGKYIVHHDMGADGFELFLSEAETTGEGSLAEGYRHMMNGEAGFVSGLIDGNRVFMVFSPILVANWSIGCVIHEEELLYSLKTLTTQINAFTSGSEERIAVMSNHVTFIILTIVAVVIVFVVMLSTSVTHIISKPIEKLTSSIAYIKTNRNEMVYGLDRSDEIGKIANVVQDMKDNLIDALEKVHYDALTGIYNRRFLEENLSHIIKSLSRSGGTLSVMMLDVDSFKKYNDTYGHDMGDVCLKKIASAIVECIDRDDDFVARYGGEEFTIVLPNTGETGANIVAKKLIESVRDCNIPHSQNDIADCVTVSIGVTTGSVTHLQDMGDYIKRADEALYNAKHTGKNKYIFLNLQGEKAPETKSAE